MGPSSPIDWTQTGIIAALVLGALWTGLKGRWIFGWVHERIVADRDRQIEALARDRDQWKEMALRLGGLTTEVVARAAEVTYPERKPP